MRLVDVPGVVTSRLDELARPLGDTQPREHQDRHDVDDQVDDDRGDDSCGGRRSQASGRKRMAARVVLQKQGGEPHQRIQRPCLPACSLSCAREPQGKLRLQLLERGGGHSTAAGCWLAGCACSLTCFSLSLNSEFWRRSAGGTDITEGFGQVQGSMGRGRKEGEITVDQHQIGSRDTYSL
jgi:hypothetical protein